MQLEAETKGSSDASAQLRALQSSMTLEELQAAVAKLEPENAEAEARSTIPFPHSEADRHTGDVPAQAEWPPCAQASPPERTRCPPA